MGLYEGIKDIANIAQKADNIELYKQLLDLGAQALDMQNQIRALKEENAELKKNKDIEQDIEYYVDSYITKKSDQKPIKYCAACWADKKKIVPIQKNRERVYLCPLCNAKIIETDSFSPRKDVIW